MTPHEVREEFARMLRLDATLRISQEESLRLGLVLSTLGCRLPMEVVTTEDRLRELPVQTLVKDTDGTVFQRWTDWTDQSMHWERMGSPDTWAHDEIGLPVHQQPHQQNAEAELTRLVTGAVVTATPDESQDDRDRYSRLLRYLQADGADVELQLITEGFVREATYDGPYERQAQYRQAEQAAKASDKGIWGSPCNAN